MSSLERTVVLASLLGVLFVIGVLVQRVQDDKAGRWAKRLLAVAAALVVIAVAPAYFL